VALLVDQVTPAGNTVADSLGLPFVTVCNALAMNPDPAVPPGVMPWKYKRGFLARLRNRFGHAVLRWLAKPIVREINDELLAKGLERIEASMQTAVNRGKLTAAEQEAARSRVRGTTQLEDFADRDLVIEAAIEDLHLKKELFHSSIRSAHQTIWQVTRARLLFTGGSHKEARPRAGHALLSGANYAVDRARACPPLPTRRSRPSVRWATPGSVHDCSRTAFIINYLSYHTCSMRFVCLSRTASKEDYHRHDVGGERPMGPSRWPTSLGWIPCPIADVLFMSSKSPGLPHPRSCARWWRLAARALGVALPLSGWGETTTLAERTGHEVNW
jgi:hypothetical protein